VSPVRVLLVDDETELRDAVAEALALEGFAVDQASGVAEAEAKFVEGKTDWVVTDLRLADGSGIELLDRLRSRDARFLAAIATGFGTYEDALDAIRLRVAAFLTKPFPLEELLRCLRESQAPTAGEDPARLSAIADRAGIARIEARVRQRLDALGVDGETAHEAFACTREALRNAERHAYPDSPGPVEVSVALDDGELVAEVADHGRGFEVGKAIAAAISERPERVPGLVRLHRDAASVRVRSEPGRGTTVTCRFPLAGRAKRAATEDELALALLWS